MLNMFVIRKYAALITASMISVVLFYVGTIYYGLLWGLLFLLIGLLMGVLVGVFMLKDPFRAMLEGQGIITFNMDSSGLLRPFISAFFAPYIKARLDGREIDDIFDRDAVFNLAAPIQAGRAGFTMLGRKVLINKKKKKEFDEAFKSGDWSGLEKDKDYKIVEEKHFALLLTEEEYNKGRFALYHYPAFIWNNQTGTLITKDFLSNLEKDIFSEHPILYLNQKVRELTSAVRDFGRHVVENIKPKGSLMANWWVWLIIGIFVIIMAVMFLPAILNTIGGISGPAATAVATAKGGAITAMP